jgi:hypothetical protein
MLSLLVFLIATFGTAFVCWLISLACGTEGDGKP